MMYRIKHISTYICAIAEANLYAFVLSLVFCKDCRLGKVFSFIHQAHLRTQKAKDDVCVSETSGQELEYSVFSLLMLCECWWFLLSAKLKCISCIGICFSRHFPTGVHFVRPQQFCYCQACFLDACRDDVWSLYKLARCMKVVWQISWLVRVSSVGGATNKCYAVKLQEYETDTTLSRFVQM